jgi:hypothetical protein
VLEASLDAPAAGATKGSLGSAHHPERHSFAARGRPGDGEDDLTKAGPAVRPGDARRPAGVDPEHGEVAVDVGRRDGSDGPATVGEGHQRLLTPQVVGVRGHDAFAEHDPTAPPASPSDTHDRRSDLRHHACSGARELFQHGHPASP